MRVLSFTDYDNYRRSAEQYLPTSAVEAFSDSTPAQQTHSLAGLLDPIRHPDTLWINEHLGKLTPNEFDLLQHMFGLQVDFSERVLQTRSFARSTSILLVGLLRFLSLIRIPPGSRILLFGDHCGYASVLLRRLGFSTVLVEWRRSNYVFQNSFMNYDLTQGFCETAFLPRLEQSPINLGIAVHIPWWHLAQFTPQPLGQFPLIVCSSTVFHLPPLAQDLLLEALARCIVGKSNGSRLLLIPDWGLLPPQERCEAQAKLEQFKLTLVHCIDGSAYCAPSDSDFALRARDHTYHGESVWSVPGNFLSDSAMSMAVNHQEWRIIPSSQIDTISQLVLYSPQSSPRKDCSDPAGTH